MTDEKNERITESNSFKKIRDYLEGGWGHREVCIGLLATAIQNKDIGIYTWDRFGRFGKADTAAEERILDLLAFIYEYENDCYDPHVGDQHPLDEASDFPDDPFSFCGWPIEKIPDFKALAEQDNEAARPQPNIMSPQKKAAFTKTQNTHLLIIGALCKKLNIDYSESERGAPVKIRNYLQELGFDRDEGTISKVLKKVQEVAEFGKD